MSREDQYSITLTIDRTQYGLFDKLGGGDMDSEETKYKGGGMAPQKALGGSPQTTNVTISRNYELGRDDEMVQALRSRLGKARAVVSKQSLDIDGYAFGRPIVYTGILKQITPPDADSESDDAAIIEVEISTDAVTS